MDEFEAIYAEYFTDVYRFLLSLCKSEALAEDLVQDAFLKAMKKADELDDIQNLRVWLCQIAKNSYLNYVEKNKRIVPLEEVQSEDDMVADLLKSENVKLIHKALRKLEEPYKEVFYLRVYGGLSFKDIAEIFEENEAWARQIFRRGKIKLKERLK